MLEQDKKSALFKLSNGASLRYSFLIRGAPGRQENFWQTWATSKAINPNPKGPPMKLGLWTARMDGQSTSPLSTLQLVCADFDDEQVLKAYLPKSTYENGPKEPELLWAELRTLLKKEFEESGKGIVTVSRHNKAKVFFAVEVQPGQIMTTDGALALLSVLLPSALFQYVDKKQQALSTTFLTQPIVKVLSSKLQHLAPTLGLIFYMVNACRSNGTKINRASIDKSEKPFREYGGEIPTVQSDGLLREYLSKTSHHERLIRILLECPGLIGTRGFQLPQSKLAKMIEVSQRTISSMLNHLERAGLLECTNSHYSYGVINSRAKTYKALGPIVDILKFIHGPDIKAGKPRRELPRSIPDGEWEAVIWKEAQHWVHHPKEFLMGVSKIPGAQEKDREQKAKRAITRWSEFFKNKTQSKEIA